MAFSKEDGKQERVSCTQFKPLNLARGGFGQFVQKLIQRGYL